MGDDEMPQLCKSIDSFYVSDDILNAIASYDKYREEGRVRSISNGKHEKEGTKIMNIIILKKRKVMSIHSEGGNENAKIENTNNGDEYCRENARMSSRKAEEGSSSADWSFQINPTREKNYNGGNDYYMETSHKRKTKRFSNQTARKYIAYQ